MSSPFLQARAAFEQVAAGALAPLNLPLQILPAREDVVGYQAHAVGAFIAFEAQRLDGSHTKARLRGWARPDGKVALLENQTLGPLLRAGGLDPASQGLTAEQWATRLVWAQGPSYTLVLKPPQLPMDAVFSPTFLPNLALNPDGTATLTYVYTRAETGGAGVVRVFRRALQLSSADQVQVEDTLLKL